MTNETNSAKSPDMESDSKLTGLSAEDKELFSLLIKDRILEILKDAKSNKDGDSKKESSRMFGLSAAIIWPTIGGVILALFNWSLSIKTERNKLENTLIIQAISTDDKDQALANLKFMSRLDLISVDPAKLEAVITDPTSQPVLPSTSGPIRYSVDSSGFLHFEDGWVAANIIAVDIPQLKGVPGISGVPGTGIVRFHKDGADQLRSAFSEIEAMGLSDRLLQFCGTFFPRTVRGANNPSIHAFGTAIDLNCGANRFGKPPVPAGEAGSVVDLVPIFKKHGFVWGGDWRTPDPMHFQLQKFSLKDGQFASQESAPSSN